MPTERRRLAQEPQEPETDHRADAPYDREELIASLQRLRPAIRASGAIVELSHVWLGQTHALAYDSGLGIRIPLATGLDCGVPGLPLLALLRTSSLKEVTLTAEETALLIKMGRSRSRLNVLDIGRQVWPFPEAPDEEASADLEESFIEAMRSVLPIRAAQPSRIEHHGILVYATRKKVELYSTDTATLARATLEIENTFPGFCLIPRPLAEQLVAQCPGGAGLYVAEDYILALDDDVEIYSNVLDSSDVADLRKVAAGKEKLHPDPVPLPAGLEAALDRVDVVAGDTEPVIDIAISGSDFRITTPKYTYGEVRERLSLEEPHPDAEITMPTSALRRGLMATDTFSVVSDDSMAFYSEGFYYVAAGRR
jgi:hypothetical protein